MFGWVFMNSAATFSWLAFSSGLPQKPQVTVTWSPLAAGAAVASAAAGAAGAAVASAAAGAGAAVASAAAGAAGAAVAPPVVGVAVPPPQAASSALAISSSASTR